MIHRDDMTAGVGACPAMARVLAAEPRQPLTEY
jgi:hypothetical protein